MAIAFKIGQLVRIVDKKPSYCSFEDGDICKIIILNNCNYCTLVLVHGKGNNDAPQVYYKNIALCNELPKNVKIL